MFMGLGVVPKAGDPFVDMIDLRQLHGHFVRVRDTRTVAAMPDHTDYIARRVAADPVPGLVQRNGRRFSGGAVGNASSGTSWSS